MWGKQQANTHPSMSVLDFTHVGELRFDLCPQAQQVSRQTPFR